jgi:hypothetical protein
MQSTKDRAADYAANGLDVRASLIPSFFEIRESEAGGIRMKRIGAAY